MFTCEAHDVPVFGIRWCTETPQRFTAPRLNIHHSCCEQTDMPSFQYVAVPHPILLDTTQPKSVPRWRSVTFALRWNLYNISLVTTDMNKLSPFTTFSSVKSVNCVPLSPDNVALYCHFCSWDLVHASLLECMLAYKANTAFKRTGDSSKPLIGLCFCRSKRLVIHSDDILLSFSCIWWSNMSSCLPTNKQLDGAGRWVHLKGRCG